MKKILLVTFLLSISFSTAAFAETGKNVEHHIVTGEHSVKSTLLRNEGFEILKEALK